MVPEDLTASRWHRDIAARVVVIGGSAGAVAALRSLLTAAPIDVPVVVAVHVPSDEGVASIMENGIRGALSVPLRTVCDKMPMVGGHVYLCPPDYHVLIERTNSFALSVEDRVHYCRPSIDVLFESAAQAFGAQVLALVLSGANADGAEGVWRISSRGGTVGVQDPAESEAAEMPRAAIARVRPDMVGSLDDLRGMLARVRFPE